MKHSTFGDPRPKGHAEMMEALDERGVDDPSKCNAEIEHNSDGGEFDGYTAEVRDNDSGDEVFSTLGYAERDDLVKDLRAAGIEDIHDL